MTEKIEKIKNNTASSNKNNTASSNKNKKVENKELYSNFFTLKNYSAPNISHNLYFNKIDKIQAKDYCITNHAYIDNKGLLQQKNWCDIKLTDYNAEIDKNNDNQINVVTDRNCIKGFCLYVKNGTYEQFRDWLNDLVLFYNAYTSEDCGEINNWGNFEIVEE